MNLFVMQENIMKGNPRVAFGAYFNVLRVLGLQDDFLKLQVILDSISLFARSRQ